jgi:hypothetical protein
MSVTVRTNKRAGGGDYERITHETGTAIQVSDGHLAVFQHSRHPDNVVAMYAPEQWHDAVVTN